MTTTKSLFGETETFEGQFTVALGLGLEQEMVQRGAIALILEHLQSAQAQLQMIWDERDEEFCNEYEISYKRIVIPLVPKKNIISGVNGVSLVEASLDRWPSIVVYAHNSTPYAEDKIDQFDTSSIPLCIEIYCLEGPIKEENRHLEEGIEAMQRLDSKVQRLTDAVHMCIKRDPSLKATVGTIEKAPKGITSLPWARPADKNATGDSYILQGKQLEYTVQKQSY